MTFKISDFPIYKTAVNYRTPKTELQAAVSPHTINMKITFLLSLISLFSYCSFCTLQSNKQIYLDNIDISNTNHLSQNGTYNQKY